MTAWYMYPLVCLGMAAVDFCYAEYTRTVADKKTVFASNWAAVMFGLLTFVTTSYVGDPWLIPAGMAGAWLGTFFSVRRHG